MRQRRMAGGAVALAALTSVGPVGAQAQQGRPTVATAAEH